MDDLTSTNEALATVAPHRAPSFRRSVGGGHVQPGGSRRTGAEPMCRGGGVAIVCLLACTGCVIELGPGGSSRGTGGAGGAGDSPTDTGSTEGPPLDRAQQARKEEVDQYILQVVYQGAEVVTSAELPSGDILDFVDRESLPGLPYELSALPLSPAVPAALPGFEIGLTELQQIPDLLEIAATATPSIDRRSGRTSWGRRRTRPPSRITWPSTRWPGSPPARTGSMPEAGLFSRTAVSQAT